MNASCLLNLACRCLTAANECSDSRSKEELREIAQELILIANELDDGQHYAYDNKQH